MKAYIKPTIEFIELKPEERLACESGGSGSGCCSGGGGLYLWAFCGHIFPWGWWCKPKHNNRWCR